MTGVQVSRRDVIVAAVLGGLTAMLVAALAGVLFTVPLGWSVLVGVVVAVPVGLATLVPGAAEPVWAPPTVRSSSVGSPLVAALGSRFADAHADPRRFALRIQPRLADVARARLRVAHGIVGADVDDSGVPGDPLDNPRARDLLGPELYRLLTDPDSTLPDPRRTAELITRLETL